MDYQVKIENFEGPLDLLLFFIQRDQLNIYDIPIADITSEFLEYINHSLLIAYDKYDLKNQFQKQELHLVFFFLLDR